MAVHPENVVDTANAKTLAEESKFCLRVLAQLNTLTGSHSNFEWVAPNGHGDRSQQNAPDRLSIQAGLRPAPTNDDDLSLVGFAPPRALFIGSIQFLQVGRYHYRTTKDITIINTVRPEINSEFSVAGRKIELESSKLFEHTVRF